MASPSGDFEESYLPNLKVQGAQVLMSCPELTPTLDFFVDRLGFRVDAIFPADEPNTAMISGHGLSLRLVVGAQRGVECIDLLCAEPPEDGQSTLTAPNGVLIRLVAADPPMKSPPTLQALVVTRTAAEDHWAVGRAGLRYRDLLPERHGGAFIASHIRVTDGGPVPDYVHFHKIRFQMIFCRRGWFRVVYENQGEPFVIKEGDCVLQPPLIRHRVLESSAGAEVIEIGAPEQHITMADHKLGLPNAHIDPQHDFSGQRFVRHVAAEASWTAWRIDGFEARDTGIAAATQGAAAARVVRPNGAGSSRTQQHQTEFCFYFVLSGRLTVLVDGQSELLVQDDCITIPGRMPYQFQNVSADLNLLEVTLPGSFETK